MLQSTIAVIAYNAPHLRSCGFSYNIIIMDEWYYYYYMRIVNELLYQPIIFYYDLHWFDAILLVSMKGATDNTVISYSYMAGICLVLVKAVPAI